MQAFPPLHGVSDHGNIDDADGGNDCAHAVCRGSARAFRRCNPTDVHEAHHESAGHSAIPAPRCTPRGHAPNRSGHQRQGHGPAAHRCNGARIGRTGAHAPDMLNQSAQCQRHHGPLTNRCEWYMPINNAEAMALDGVFGRECDTQREPDHGHNRAEPCEPEPHR